LAVVSVEGIIQQQRRGIYLGAGIALDFAEMPPSLFLGLNITTLLPNHLGSANAAFINIWASSWVISKEYNKSLSWQCLWI